MAALCCLRKRRVRDCSSNSSSMATNKINCWVGFSSTYNCCHARKCSYVATPRAVPRSLRNSFISEACYSNISDRAYLVVNEADTDGMRAAGYLIAEARSLYVEFGLKYRRRTPLRTWSKALIKSLPKVMLLNFCSTNNHVMNLVRTVSKP